MVTVSYAISPRIKEALNQIEGLRREILLVPLSPKRERELRWEAMLNRIYYSLALTGNPLRKSEMLKLLASPSPKRLTKEELEIMKYRQALDYVTQNWLVSTKVVRVADILIVYDIACYGKLRIAQTELQHLLDYLQAREEHPVLQAAIAGIELIKLRPFTDGNGRIARLTALLFLYRSGYDFRGFLSLEKYWLENMVTFRENSRIGINAASSTLWLEYFCETIAYSLASVLEHIKTIHSHTGVEENFWQLSDRQKTILSILDEPNKTISNRNVQKLFNISQITASRDLAKLAILGLLFKHGQGRSVYYTKV